MAVHTTDMTEKDALKLVQLFEQNQIEVTLDGGWGVDALLGEQTRAHADLDIVIPYKDVTLLRTLLEAQGYTDVPRLDSRDCNFVLGDEQGRLVDVHTYTLDRVNHPEQGLDYPLESLTGMGSILEHPVRCITVENMVKFHTGYEVDEIDYGDVKALCLRFGIDLPEEYNKFEQKSNFADNPTIH
jgi:lincosamide nucleotidyltransferase A/C/D/E